MKSVFDALNPTLRKAVEAVGYTTPTPIQERAIPPILAGADLIGCAQTGTGKTAAFALPILNRLAAVGRQPRPNRPQALILAPTRELAAQIGDNVETFARRQRISCGVVFGGVNIAPQIRRLSAGVAVLVATPGRLLDLCAQKALFLDDVGTVVLDEADRMLDMGFLPDIRRILERLPARRQSLFFSATFSPEITALAEQFVRGEAVSVRIDPGKPAVERIRQTVFFVDKENKLALLKEILEDPKAFRVIVFPRMKHGADRLCKQLTKAGFKAAALHGDKSQNARLRALSGFRDGTIHVLVATDIAARGIDVDDVTHVINFDLPDEPETYVHRIGRTARAGADGEAISLVAAQDRNALRDIERFIRRSIPQKLDHPYHSESARTAMGAAASRPPRGNSQKPGPRGQKPSGRNHEENSSARRPFAFAKFSKRPETGFRPKSKV